MIPKQAYFAPHEGFVQVNTLGRNHISLSIPSLGITQPPYITAQVFHPYHTWSLPDVGSVVVVEFMGGDPNRPIVRNHSYGDTKTPDGKTLATDMVFVTPGGWKIIIDEVAAKATITDGTTKIELDKTANKVIVDAANIELTEGATEAMVKGTAFKTAFDAFITAYNAHVHVGNLGGSTAPPTGAPQTTTVDLSTKNKTG